MTHDDLQRPVREIPENTWKTPGIFGSTRFFLPFRLLVHQTIPDPADQAPLVARSVTPPSPSGRGGTALLRQRAPRSCTVFVMPPPNEHSSEGGRDDRGVPYHAESTLSSAQVLKSRLHVCRKNGYPTVHVPHTAAPLDGFHFLKP